MKDEENQSPKKPQYADSSISDKAFKRMIFWFFIYCALFCIGVIVTIGLDHAAIS